jgi:hypothetical protein
VRIGGQSVRARREARSLSASKRLPISVANPLASHVMIPQGYLFKRLFPALNATEFEQLFSSANVFFSLCYKSCVLVGPT